MSLVKGCIKGGIRATARCTVQSRSTSGLGFRSAQSLRAVNFRKSDFTFNPFENVSKRMYGGHAHHGEEDEEDDHHHHHDRTTVDIPAGARVFTREQVFEHNSVSDCWIIIANKVYNVTTWLDIHPGGRDIIMAHAGKDASAAFAAIGHSHMAKEAMMEFHVGYVDKQKRFTGLPDPIM